jgi:hypothetical protein
LNGWTRPSESRSLERAKGARSVGTIDQDVPSEMDVPAEERDPTQRSLGHEADRLVEGQHASRDVEETLVVGDEDVRLPRVDLGVASDGQPDAGDAEDRGRPEPPRDPHSAFA